MSTRVLNASDCSLSSCEDTNRRRSVFYIPLVESFDSYMPLTPEEEAAILSSSTSSVSTSFNREPPMRARNSSVSSAHNPKKLSVIPLERRLVRVRARELEVCKTPHFSAGLSASKSASRLNVSSNENGLSKTAKSSSKPNLSLPPDSAKLSLTGKERSRTLPQNTLATSTPIKSSSSSAIFKSSSKGNLSVAAESKTPAKIGLNFIRRTHSTKLTRSNSLLRSLTPKTPEQNGENLQRSLHEAFITDLSDKRDPGRKDLLASLINGRLGYEMSPSPITTRKTVLRSCLDFEDDAAIHSDTSYEKACRRGSAPSTPILGASGVQHSPSRLAAFFFSKRSFRANPLKRTKSATKLERDRTAAPATPTAVAAAARANRDAEEQHALRTSRSHESLLSAHSAAVSTVDLGTHQVEIRALHASVLGRPHCFALSADGRSPRYFACASRRERDRWIYSLKQSVWPGADKLRRCERSLKLWILEAKAIPPKKRYYCELLLDNTLYARTSTKLKTDLCFWGEVFEFQSLPAATTICINIYREPDRKVRKRDKHCLVGSVKIPVDDVTVRHHSERWYPILSEKQSPQNTSQSMTNGSQSSPSVLAGNTMTASTNSSSSNGSQGATSSLRVKCRYQSVDILPIELYAEFLDYLKRNYKRVCEYLEPVIGVKAKEDIAGALVLAMQASGRAPLYLADVVSLDVRRTGDHSLTFRGNSLATKSMEAYLKMLGDQYLQDTLSELVTSVLSSQTECEVDPMKVNGAATLRKQQAALRSAVELAWNRIIDSSAKFPPELRECFATFRERLSAMGRDDISDNLISASIFLRFLCPAILSPSLFGITHEYPNERAARNLTLVAKTLQTLANFTRFQGKEAFMEFLNDFLEREAPRMKGFLKEISTRHSVDMHHRQNGEQKRYSDHQDSNHLSDGHARQHRQQNGDHRHQNNGDFRDHRMNGDHRPLSNGDQRLKMEEEREAKELETAHEWAPHIDLGKQLSLLHTLLTENMSKLQTGRLQELDPLASILDNLHHHHLGVHSPHQNNNSHGVPQPQIVDNIFRFNDPTYNPNVTPNMQQCNLSISPNFAHSSPILNKNSVHFNDANMLSQEDALYPKYKMPHNNILTQLGLKKSPSMSSRSATLPRNGFPNAPVVNQDRYSSQYNNQEHCVNPKVGQIGFDNQNVYVKSPVKQNLAKSGSNHNLNSSQLSIASDRSNNERYNYQNNFANGNNPNANIPTHLEELSDLLRYADDQETEENINQKINNQVNNNQIHQNGGSNVSISALSNVASSGYQSFATYSQSSSPVELCTNQNGASYSDSQNMGRFLLNHHNNRNRYDRQHSYGKNAIKQKIDHDLQKYGIHNFTTDSGLVNNNAINTPLAFTNPVYHMENNNGQAPAKRSVSTTSGSSLDEEGDVSENVETNSEENFKNRNKTAYLYPVAVQNQYQQQQQQQQQRNNQSPLIRRTPNARAPRTNPLLNYPNPPQIRHFGQKDLYVAPLTVDPPYPTSNVEEMNKEMYKLQISRSQRAFFNPDQKITVTENGYPLERDYSKQNISSTRLNEEMNAYHNASQANKPQVKSVIFGGNLEHSASDRQQSPAVSTKDKLQRRLSLESARDLSDSSSDMEDNNYYNTTGRRRPNKNHRTIEQYEREIERLQRSVDLLRTKLQQASDSPQSPNQTVNGDGKCVPEQPDTKMKAIISRLISVEEELRREQRKMSLALNHKQRVIEAQEHRIAALDAANERLLSALTNLQQQERRMPSNNNSRSNEVEI